ncbi:MAG: DNA polymerase III subunit gamma/tau [Tannerellaceae bacterium]|nr:DNA polymerase III subunit gamma/tau [Tannerellaceae bacterium]
MDNYIVSARKYRPSTFRSVVGQKSLTTTLKNAISTNKLAHAYLFCGPRGVGKTSCARIFAKTINCLDITQDGEACNACESCQAFNEQRSYNIHELDAASNNSVDDIRSLIDQVRIPPAIGKYKVFIIDEVHMLSSQAFNAFLKTLEEPPHHALFILATTEKHKVLPTILSRCQIYDFSRISVADMVEHMEHVASLEQVTAEPEALNVIAQKADGGMRDALSVFDQAVSFTNGNITYQAVIDNLNILDYDYYFRFTDAMLRGEVSSAMLTLNEVMGRGFDGQNIITGLATHFRDLLVCRDEATLALFEVGASIRDRYREMAKRCPEKVLYKAIELANACDLNYKASRNKRLLLELTLIQLCQLTNPEPVSPQPSLQPVATAPAAPKSGTTTTTQLPPAAPVLPPKETPPPAPPKKSATQPPVSTSLKEIANDKAKGQAVAQPTPAEEGIATPFLQDDLVTYWDEYLETIENNMYLKSTMINCKPVLQENFHFEVTIHNPGQQEELINNSINILPFLRHRLKNNHVQMRIRISDTTEKKPAYTSAEKYEHLLEINPAIEKLKTEFNLTVD